MIQNLIVVCVLLGPIPPPLHLIRVLSAQLAAISLMLPHFHPSTMHYRIVQFAVQAKFWWMPELWLLFTTKRVIALHVVLGSFFRTLLRYPLFTTM